MRNRGNLNLKVTLKDRLWSWANGIFWITIILTAGIWLGSLAQGKAGENCTYLPTGERVDVLSPMRSVMWTSTYLVRRHDGTTMTVLGSDLKEDP